MTIINLLQELGLQHRRHHFGSVGKIGLQTTCLVYSEPSTTYKWSPHVGKFGGTGGKSACVPTCKIKFMPMVTWKRKWQWNSHALVIRYKRKWLMSNSIRRNASSLTQDCQLWIWTQHSRCWEPRLYLSRAANHIDDATNRDDPNRGHASS